MYLLIGISILILVISIFKLFKVNINIFTPSFFLWFIYLIYFFIGELIFDLLISLDKFENILFFEELSPHHPYIALYIYISFLSLSLGILSANLLLRNNIEILKSSKLLSYYIYIYTLKFKNTSKLLIYFLLFLIIIELLITFFLFFKFGTVFNYNTWDDLRTKLNIEGYWKFIIIDYIWLTPITITLATFLFFLYKKNFKKEKSMLFLVTLIFF